MSKPSARVAARIGENPQFFVVLKMRNWNQSTDCCYWGGITCDQGGRVIILDLSNQLISGTIDNSSSLFNLQHLQQLNLAYNTLSFSFPCGFDKLSNLSYLNLSNAG
ncbi:hypothetical protein GOBAR_DD05408 [Gossypium barbadense]|nr:hypothetical protein GOBAR_DD05408 [Gossypium barbadense]